MGLKEWTKLLVEKLKWVSCGVRSLKKGTLELEQHMGEFLGAKRDEEGAESEGGGLSAGDIGGVEMDYGALLLCTGFSSNGAGRSGSKRPRIYPNDKRRLWHGDLDVVFFVCCSLSRSRDLVLCFMSF